MTIDFSFQVDQYCCRSLQLATQTRYLKKVTNQVTFCHWGLAVTVEEPLGQAGSSVSSIKAVIRQQVRRFRRLPYYENQVFPDTLNRKVTNDIYFYSNMAHMNFEGSFEEFKCFLGEI